MACTYSSGFVPLPAAPTASHGGRRGILQRLFDAIYESRRNKTEVEIARFLERRGGRITDENERQIAEHLLGGDWRARDWR